MAGYLTISDVAVGEGAGQAIFTVTLLAPTTETVTVRYDAFDRTAGFGSDDYERASGTLTFLPGETVKTIAVDVNDDTREEGLETFGMFLSNATGATIAKAESLGIIVDNDTTRASGPRLIVDDLVVNETDGTASIVVRMDAASAQTVTVDFATVGDTARAGSDFVAETGTLTFRPGETATTVTVDLVQDGLAEGEERFFFDLSGAGNASIGHGRAEVRIAAHEQIQAIPSLSVGDLVVGEGDRLARFEVSLSAPTTETVTVRYDAFNRTADFGSDDYERASGTLTFLPGETVKTVVVDINDDTREESLETFGMFLSNAAGATIARAQSLGIIVDNDTTRASGPRLIVDDLVLNESDGTASVAVRMDAASAQTVTVGFTTIGDTARAGSDFVAKSGTLTFLPGETAATVTVDLVQDGLAEDEERLFLDLSGAANAAIGHGRAEVRIAAHEQVQAIPSLSVGDLVVGEGDRLARFEVSLSAPTTETVTVRYDAFNRTADFGSDDYERASGTLTFLAGETVKTVVVDVNDDIREEGIETFGLLLSNATGATIAKAQSLGIIVDNDTTRASGPRLIVDDVVVNESDGTASVAVRMDAASAQTVTVDFATVGDTARVDRDFVAETGTLTFLPGETAKSVLIDLIDDADAESIERLFLDLSRPSGAALGDGRGEIRIGANDAPPNAIPFLTMGNVAVSEADKLARVEVSLSAPATEAVTVRYDTVDGTARSGSDDYERGSGTLTFLAGETVRTITIDVNDDTGLETSETFGVRLSNASGATIPRADALATIVDNDTSTPAGPRITGSNTIVNEGDGYATFAVNLTQRNAGPVTVEYALVNGTARVGTDVVQQTGTLTFLPADTSETVRFRLLDDLLPEKAETFALRLFGAQGAQFVSGSELRLTATINDNDAAPYRATLARESFVASATVSTVDYVLSDKLVAVNLTSGRGAGGYAAGDTFSGIANIYGSAHNDRLTGDAAINVFDGRAGNDILKALGGDDSLQGNVGDDRLDGGTGDDLLRGGVGNDFLIGGIGDDSLLGDAGDDRLVGGAGNDRLVGGAGNDIIDGGIGVDILTGNTGIDVFVFNRPADGVDIVTDFNRAADVLSLVNAVRGFDGSAASATGFVAFTVSGRDTILRLDANGGGDGFLDLAILKNVTGLTVGIGLRDGWLDLE